LLRDAALAAALPVAGVEERDSLVAEILPLTDSPRSETLLNDVIQIWPELSGAARSAVLAHLGQRVHALIARLRESRDPADRRASAFLAVACLTNPDVARMSGDSSDPDFEFALSEMGLSSEIDAALATAASEFTEQRLHSVLDVIARVAHCAGPRLRAFLADESQAAHLPLRAAAKSLPLEVQHQRAVLWLAIPSLAALARMRLQTPRSLDDKRLALEQSHYLLARYRERAARRLDEPSSLLVGADDLAELEPSARLGQIRWIERLNLKDARKLELLTVCLADPEARVRFGAVAALSRMSPTKQVDETLVDFAYDSDERVACEALAALADAQTPARRRFHAPVFDRLQRSPHARVRLLAASVRSEFDPWAEPDDCWSCPVAARMRLTEQPLEFLIELRREYQVSGAEHRIRLLGLAARLGVLDRLESELIDAAVGADERLASKAALLLPRVDSPDVRAVLNASIDDGPARVRANAVEGLAIACPTDERLDGFASHSIPRLRANVIRHFLRTRPHAPESERNLAEMLTDPRPAHRLSALWVAERSPVFNLVARIADMTRSDPDPQVHARARVSARLLLAAMRQGWAGAPAQGVVVTRPHASASTTT
jgi:hypothetical protein